MSEQHCRAWGHALSEISPYSVLDTWEISANVSVTAFAPLRWFLRWKTLSRNQLSFAIKCLQKTTTCQFVCLRVFGIHLRRLKWVLTLSQQVCHCSGCVGFCQIKPRLFELPLNRQSVNWNNAPIVDINTIVVCCGCVVVVLRLCCAYVANLPLTLLFINTLKWWLWRRANPLQPTKSASGVVLRGLGFK